MLNLWTALILGWLSVSGGQVTLGYHVPLSGYDVLSGYGLQAALWTAGPAPMLDLGLALNLDGFKGEERYRLSLWGLGPMLSLRMERVSVQTGVLFGRLHRRMGTGQEQGSAGRWILQGSYAVARWPGAEIHLLAGYAVVPGREGRFHFATMGLGVRWYP